jgi:hypothetical protein
MQWEYSYENHDWDMTLGAARELIAAGDRIAAEQSDGRFLSYYTGSMLLSFCAVESFVNSLAYVLHRSAGDSRFNYRKYGRINGIWKRLEEIAKTINVRVDRSRQPFARLARMRDWRNDMVHSQPFSVAPVLLDHPDQARGIPAGNGAQSYLRFVTRSQAHAFYRGAFVTIARLQRASGLEPTTYVAYRDLRSNETIRIQRRTVQLGKEAVPKPGAP